jgi:pimeloyl-ACP methyl ester carboxylesterase
MLCRWRGPWNRRSRELWRGFGCVLLAHFALATCCAYAAESTAWQYRLSTGDHLVYAETAERHISGEKADVVTRATFTSHVIVVGSVNGRTIVGFQRMRESADLLSYREGGKDRMAVEGPKFRTQMAARPIATSEANEMDTAGHAAHPWLAVRESNSRYLLAIHEIETLPGKVVAPGAEWTGPPPLTMQHRFQGFEEMAGERCALIEGSVQTLDLKYWFCPESGAIRKIEYHGEYMTFAGKADERVTFELKERRARETLQSWLATVTTSQAAVRALLISPAIKVSADELKAALRSTDTTTQTLMLSLIYRQRLAYDDALVQPLANSSDAQVARMAARVLADKSLANAPSARSALAAGTYLRYMSAAGYEGYPYILHVPPDYRGDKPFPLIVHLTGGPGIAMDGANNSETAIAGIPYLVVYPHAAGKMWWEKEPTAMMDRLLDELVSVLNIRPSGIYVTGFSNGGTGAVFYASKWPTRFGALVSLMGAGPCVTDMGEIRYDSLASMPTLIVHGTKDPIIPTDCSERLYEGLKKHHKAELALKILKDRGHDITLASDDGLTLQFLDKLSAGQSGH